MSQRIRRAKDRKNGATMSTGGHIVHHDRGEEVVVRTPPMKSTGNIPGEQPGFAKASPFFKKLAEVMPPKSKAEEKKVIAEASKPVQPVIEEDEKDEDNEAE
mgnify:CR=1 FL=1